MLFQKLSFKMRKTIKKLLFVLNTCFRVSKSKLKNMNSIYGKCTSVQMTFTTSLKLHYTVQQLFFSLLISISYNIYWRRKISVNIAECILLCYLFIQNICVNYDGCLSNALECFPFKPAKAIEDWDFEIYIRTEFTLQSQTVMRVYIIRVFIYNIYVCTFFLW